MTDNQASPILSPNHVKRKRIMFFLMILLIITGICAAILWWLFYQNYETTEDAYVNGPIIVLSSRQDGSVVSYHVEATDYVREGDPLVMLDPIDYLAKVEEKKASLAMVARGVRGIIQDVNQKEANVKLVKAKYDRAQLNYKNREPLKNSEAIPQEEIENAESDFKVQQAALDLAQFQLEAIKSQLGNPPFDRHPDIEKAKVELLEALLLLSRSKIKAPVSGYIANKNVQLGQSIKAGTPLMNIVPLDSVWVDANFKETQLEHFRIGQPVTLISDMYGRDFVFHGKIEGLLPGTGSAFSLLPTQNATGNWIKIVQRVGVRISLDKEEIKKAPLVLGLSMTATVDITNKEGLRLADKPVVQTSKTSIFDVDLAEFNPLINQIVEENLQLR